MRGLEAVTGRRYGPFDVGVSPDKVVEFVAATGDDSARWREHAPPGWLATMLFAAAPQFFADPDVAPYTGALIHAEQRFAWSGPLPTGTRLQGEGVVSGVRVRGALNLVSFEVAARPAGGAGPEVTSFSTFVMAAAGEQPASSEPEDEPPADERAGNSVLDAVALPAEGEALPPLLRSASRADLVRYAGATRDFNPIHWDHGAAVAAGLPGVVVHGLLMGAWAAQAAARAARPGPHPLAALRLRFRKPLRPAAPAEVTAEVKAREQTGARLGLAVRSGGEVLVTGDADILLGGGSPPGAPALH